MATLGERIRELRVKNRWTQKELADRVGVRQKQISCYERDENIPSGEFFIALANAFDVSLDYLAQRADDSGAQLSIADRDLLQKVQEVDRLPDIDRDLVKGVIDAVLLKDKFKQLVNVSSKS